MNHYHSHQTIYKSERVTVSRAISESDGKSVILKSQTSEFPSQRDITRIKYEYELSKKFSPKGMVPILGLEKQGNGFTLVMEDVGGIPLLDYWNSKSKSISHFLELAISITKNLSNLHENGIIHKDIKPANILVSQTTNQVYLIDLGLASLLSSEEQAPVQPHTLEGTLSYISPEQTGRMNRSIDFRCDLYSLGITFYEILTGDLPFTGKDSVELVHAHIAISPLPPIEVHKEIPLSLSDLILKLLSKNAEDRYHSTKGLLDDLSLALELLKESKPIEFIPGEKESKSIFIIPQKLYGREAEVSFLLEAFNRTAESPFKKYDKESEEPYGGVKLVLIGGYSGVGKTALINEVHKPILEKRGNFISGKFDQFKRNIPYYSLIQAFTGLIRQILTEKEENINVWKEKILKACSPNTALLTELIPELLHITGTPPPLPEFSAQEAEDRFVSTLLRFVEVFATLDHPLTIFVDDLQWADSPTLKFLETLTKSKETHHLLLLGAYRDNEINPLHPFTQMVQNLEKVGIEILKITLAPLMEFFIERMICDTFHKEVGSELPELVYQKTGGNPFFVRQFLKNLYIDGCISYSSSSGWVYDLEKIKTTGYTENVVELVANRLKTLSAASIEILKIASCIGANFSLSLLSFGYQKSIQETALALKEALREGIILPENSSYRSAEVVQNDTIFKLEDTSYRFIHDRVQQAANSLLTEEDKKRIHVLLGKTLLKSLNSEELDSQIFEVVNHFNYGTKDSLSLEEREELIQLNYKAGIKAGESFAFGSALQYFEKSKNLIEEETLRELKLKINFEFLSALYKSGLVLETLEKLDDLFKISTTKYEKSLIYNLKIICYNAIGKYEDSVLTCQEALKLFDIELKNDITINEIFLYYKKLSKKIKSLSMEELYNLPEMQNLEIRLIMEILMNGIASAYWKLPNFSTIFILVMVDFSLEYGNFYATTLSFSYFGGFITSLGDHKRGYEFGQLGLKLYNKFPHSSTALKVINTSGIYINNWIEHIRKSEELLIKGFNRYSDTKDIVFSCIIIGNAMIYNFIGGQDLQKLIEKYKPYIKYFKDNQSKHFYYFCNYIFTFIEELKGNNPIWIDFDNNEFSEQEYTSNLESNELKVGLYYYYINKLYLDFLFHKYNYINYIYIKKYREYGVGTINYAQDFFVSSLLILKLNLKESDIVEDDTKKELESYIKKFKTWSEINPANFKHKYNLILAEYAKYKKEFWEAAEYYDIAIESAIQNEYNLDAGLCAELAGAFYLEQNRIQQAKRYFQTSLYYYDLCGAKAKVRHVKELYPQYTSDAISSSGQQISFLGSTSTRTEKSGNIDLTSVLRATAALAEEHNMNILLSKLMKVLVENAGASRTVLIELEQDQLYLEAEYSIEDREVMLYKTTPIEKNSNLPHSLFTYIKRTGESVLLGDVKTDDRWRDEHYFKAIQEASLLCFPILNKGSMKGILYLENTNSTHVFTEERLNVLQMISNQASISIENARLYQSMELKIQERTQELSAKNKSIEELNLFIKTINESSDLDFILDKIHSHIKKNFSIEHFGLGIVDKDSMYARTVYLTYPKDLESREFIKSTPIPVRNTKGAHSLAFNSNKPFFVKRIRLDRIPAEEQKVVQTFNLKSILILPLILKGENIGYFDLFNGEKELIVSKEQINQLSILAEQLAGIIYSSNLYQELQSQKQELESTLSELRTTQAQLVEAEKSAALGQLISGVAHEINNPLAAIRSSAEILEMDQSKIMQEIPSFFQKNPQATLEFFLHILAESEKNLKHLPSREERKRKKEVFSKMEGISFKDPSLKDQTIELLTELWLEDLYPSFRQLFSEEIIHQILKYISLFSIQKNALKNIKLSTEKSSRVIFSLRKYLKTEIRGTPRDITVSEMIDKSLSVYINYIQGIVTVKKEVNFNPTINCVVDEMLQVFKNLIFNAIQSMYLSENKILKIIIESYKNKDISYLKISFEDTGHGIDSPLIDKLFTPFFTTKARGEGIGLGLYVSKSITEEHNGKLEYEPMEMGSKFIVLFPV
jgi:predicted ATPase/C4-dicarboxylate-specific signal transduction histidine kinase